MEGDEGTEEGTLGWVRLGCGIVLLVILPLWLGLLALMIHISHPQWQEAALEDGGEALGRVDWLGIGLESALWVLVLFGGAILLLGLGRGVSSWMAGRADRDRRTRYDAIVGDGDVLRQDAWDVEPTEEE